VAAIVCIKTVSLLLSVAYVCVIFITGLFSRAFDSVASCSAAPARTHNPPTQQVGRLKRPDVGRSYTAIDRVNDARILDIAYRLGPASAVTAVSVLVCFVATGKTSHY
jgi:hypothetical protein